MLCLSLGLCISEGFRLIQLVCSVTKNVKHQTIYFVIVHSLLIFGPVLHLPFHLLFCMESLLLIGLLIQSLSFVPLGIGTVWPHFYLFVGQSGLRVAIRFLDKQCCLLARFSI